jgi:hypothetical protein
MVSSGTYGFIFGGRTVPSIAYTNAIYKYDLFSISTVSNYGTLTYYTIAAFGATDTITAMVAGGYVGGVVCPPTSTSSPTPIITSISQFSLITQGTTTKFANLWSDYGAAFAATVSNGHGGL